MGWLVSVSGWGEGLGKLFMDKTFNLLSQKQHGWGRLGDGVFEHTVYLSLPYTFTFHYSARYGVRLEHVLS